MDERPAMKHFEDQARARYGHAYGAAAIARRHGTQLGYWSFYLENATA